MRKALCIFLTLFIVISLGFGTAHSLVNDTKDQVTWEETIFLGDRSKVSGLQVTSRNSQGNNLLWESTGVLGGDPQPRTEFTFSNSYIHWEEEFEYQGITMQPSTSIHGLIREEMEDTGVPTSVQAPYQELIDHVRACADSVNVGEEKFFTVDMADFLTYYPLDIYFDIENFLSYSDLFDSIWANHFSDQLLRDLNDYFRIPILGDYFIEFSLNRISPNSTSLGGSADLTYTPNFWGCSTQDAVYFSFTATTEDGQVADMSLLPEGYGIYKLNYSWDEKNAFQPGTPLVEMVFPLDPSIPYAGLDVSEDHRFLYLHRWMGADCVRTVIDLETMQELQTIPLASLKLNYNIRNYDGFTTVVQYGGEAPVTISLFEELQDGTFSHRFTVPVNSETFLTTFRMDLLGFGDYDMAYDGKRLAVVQNGYAMDTHSHYRDICDFYVVVYEESGMSFAGRYHVNLTDINPEANSYDTPCTPFYQCPIETSWQ